MNSVQDVLEKECCTSVEFIPPGITGLAQPMYISVMKEFKTYAETTTSTTMLSMILLNMPLLDVLLLRRLL
ncbi:hypothetical protein JG687_00011308 [Phytophthora cactorum]|uniref:Uncharacterized protein n=1 Tax=Phytophthora cactorum TaxID=29920 RepID=A0A8T1UA25_9STRA|nr:hypothetical protein JG687_00011308 [Phytophthora cactorum]